VEGWARTAAAAGYTVQTRSGPDAWAEPADLVLIEGPVPESLPKAGRSFVIDDGSPGPILAERMRRVAGIALLCPDQDRLASLAAEGLAVRNLAPALEAWRWMRPIRPARLQARIVVATDAAAGLLPGLATLPIADAGSEPRYAPSVQAVVLLSPENRLFNVLAALATGLPLVLPHGRLRWLGPLAALRCPAEEAPAALKRLAFDPTAWFDQAQEGLNALKRVAHPSRFRDDLAALMEA
jgi:hypothetical protein